MTRQRTKAEVIEEQRGVIGCCEAYANRQSCDCLETAVDELLPPRKLPTLPVDDFAFLVGNYAYRPCHLPGAQPECYSVDIRRIISVGPGVVVVQVWSAIVFWEIADCFNTYEAAADNARWQAERRGLVFREPEGRKDKG